MSTAKNYLFFISLFFKFKLSLFSDCVFPFTYSGEIFNTCTRKNSQNGKPWCATAVNELNGEVMRGQWGDCDKSCIASGRWPEEQATGPNSIVNVTQLTPNDMYNSQSRYHINVFLNKRS